MATSSVNTQIARPVYRDCEIKHSTTHHIVTRGLPVAERPWPMTMALPPDRLKITKLEFEYMLKLSIIRNLTATGLHPCIWYRRSHRVTGGHVVMTVHLSNTPFLITIQFPICRIFHPPSKVHLFSPRHTVMNLEAYCTQHSGLYRTVISVSTCF